LTCHAVGQAAGVCRGGWPSEQLWSATGKGAWSLWQGDRPRACGHGNGKHRCELLIGSARCIEKCHGVQHVHCRCGLYILAGMQGAPGQAGQKAAGQHSRVDWAGDLDRSCHGQHGMRGVATNQVSCISAVLDPSVAPSQPAHTSGRDGSSHGRSASHQAQVCWPCEEVTAGQLPRGVR